MERFPLQKHVFLTICYAKQVRAIYGQELYSFNLLILLSTSSESEHKKIKTEPQLKKLC